MIIYIAENLINGKQYIGQTKFELDIRKKQHLRSAKNGSTATFHCAIRKYGENNFTWKVLCSGKTREELNILEQKYVGEFGSYASGYNNDHGGRVGKMTRETIGKILETKRKNGTINPSLETKKKISRSHIGMKYPKSFGERLTLANTGKKMTDEAKQNMRVAQIKRWAEITPENLEKFKQSASISAKRRFTSNEERKKISDSLIGKKKSSRHIENLIKSRTIVFTELEMERMLVLREGGLSYRKISVEFNVSWSKIRSVLKEYKRKVV